MIRKDILVAACLALALAPVPASAFGLLDTVQSVLDSNVSEPRDRPEVQQEIEHNDTSREERDYLDTSREEREHSDTSKAERDYYDSFNR